MLHNIVPAKAIGFLFLVLGWVLGLSSIVLHSWLILVAAGVVVAAAFCIGLVFFFKERAEDIQVCKENNVIKSLQKQKFELDREIEEKQQLLRNSTRLQLNFNVRSR